jgi:uridine kinase
LLEGKPFNIPVFDKLTKQRSEESLKVNPSNIIIVEGHLIFTNEELMKLMNLKVYIDTDDDVRLSRRVLKASHLSGGDLKNLSDMLYKYEKQIKPAYEKWIEPTKKYADIIIPNYAFTDISRDIKIKDLIPNIPAIALIIKQVESLTAKKIRI